MGLSENWGTQKWIRLSFRLPPRTNQKGGVPKKQIPPQAIYGYQRFWLMCLRCFYFFLSFPGFPLKPRKQKALQPDEKRGTGCFTPSPGVFVRSWIPATALPTTVMNLAHSFRSAGESVGSWAPFVDPQSGTEMGPMKTWGLVVSF